MDFKKKIFIWAVTLGALFIYRYEIAEHFNLEHLLPEPVKEKVAPKLRSLAQGEENKNKGVVLPKTAFIAVNDVAIYRNPGRGVIAKGNVGDEVSVLDTLDEGQSYIEIRYNGIAGYISRGDLKFQVNQEGE